MPSTPTTKYGFITEADADALVGAPGRLRTLVTAIDSNMAGYSSGTIASLPAAAASGRIYRATDVRAILLDTGSAWVDLVPQRVTSLPGTPYDGQVIHYVADATNGVLWPLRYNASGGTYKWEVVGPQPLQVENTTLSSVPNTSGGYADVAGDVGPSITVPLAGEYMVSFGVNVTTDGANEFDAALKFGAAAISAFDRSRAIPSSGNISVRVSRDPYKRAITPAATVVKLQYKNAGSVGASIEDRTIAISPIRVA
jgi:hypothetical protein